MKSSPACGTIGGSEERQRVNAAAPLSTVGGLRAVCLLPMIAQVQRKPANIG